ncbi:MAG: amino acid permease [Saprospiraceae bacterium]|nr:amino acid permease [Saprospiraceae bacterium]HMW39781.1 amino acid permease [Saprospiraceae bacterium]HMX89395.1 amino acid permease [Saprospiraceae bacterium]HMZ39957.1 amino acid permease [Saprospiraceae bacterium]HNA65405.1 amino acid permease [Saprospiraceae bacterium]
MVKLRLIDGVFLVAGSMIGSGIFIVSADIARTTAGGGFLLLSWFIAGLMTLLGALAFAELSGMFPKSGGQYIYLREAYNPFISFLYGWTIFMVVNCGTIAAVAVAFSKYSGELVPWFSMKNILLDLGFVKISSAQLLSVVLIVFLTWLNAKGIQYGKFILRIFTSVKIISLAMIIILGLLVFRNADVWQINLLSFWNAQSVRVENGEIISRILSGTGLLMAIGTGLVGSLFSCDAWTNVSYIAGEIERPSRNIPKSLIYGVGLVALLFLLVNVAYLNLLPLTGSPGATDAFSKGIQFADQDRVGTAAATVMFGASATIIMAVLIMISTFGCNNGIILAGARMYQAMAADGLFFAKMKDNNRNEVPGFALWIQAIWASVLCLSGQYGQLLDYVMFSVMIFYIITIVAVYILRVRRPDIERPYKAMGYPYLPALYILLAAAFCLNLIINKPEFCVPSLVIVFLGAPVYFIWRRVYLVKNS